nr:YigZ family protein [Cellulosilyticum sp. I15G10I2]
MNGYKTISHENVIEIFEKKSRFIATVCPVTSVEEADQILGELRKKYYNASHNCFAYQIGEQSEIQKCSDDGEPQGTAGKPILDVLKGEAITNTLICVTRYFGGTLLGTGGLVRAYGRAAKEGLYAAGIAEKRHVKIFYLEAAYSLSGKVQYLLNDKGYTIRHTTYLEAVTFEVEVLMGQEDFFYNWIIDTTNAEILVQEGEYTLITIPLPHYC